VKEFLTTAVQRFTERRKGKREERRRGVVSRGTGRNRLSAYSLTGNPLLSVSSR
jgi:hypothetical protein